jgi:hypothetical protein
MAETITYSTKDLSKPNVSGFTELNSTLKPIEQPNIQKKEFVNKVSNQKDVTIDLSQFLDLPTTNEKEQTNRFLDNV